MPSAVQKTTPDTGPARRAARDQWARSALEVFLDACHHRHDDPGRSLELIRKILEGWAHAVSVSLDPDFAPHKGGGLHTRALGDLLPRVLHHLPPDLQDFVKHAKKLGDRHHHNQGERSNASRLTAQARLLECAALLQWLHREVLLESPPRELEAALFGLQVPAPRRTRSRAALGLGLALLGTFGVAVWALARSTASVTLVASPAAPRSGFETLGEPERSWIEAYQGALDARDVDRILARHVLPARRFFMARNYDAARLRRALQGWYKRAGPDRRTGFDRCSLVDVGSDGSRALQCDTHIDPPFASGPARTPACLVFTREGKVLSRTELATIPRCPPL